MFAAAASGSGKTTAVCGLMKAFKQKQYKVAAAKCGPDYIDPIFHQEVLGIESENLDLFFCDNPTVCQLFAEHTKDADISVIEGVMGYYDGISLSSTEASSYAVAKALNIPVILVISCRGMAVSVLAQIKGFIEFRAESNIQGILLNRVSSMLYPRMKQMIEEGLQGMGYSVPVVGFIPEDDIFQWKSRHLGLVLPNQLEDIKKQITAMGKVLAETVDFGQILKIAGGAPELEVKQPSEMQEPQVKVGIARDQAFGFYYKDNLKLLRKLGCELVEFSPLVDEKLPEGISGLLLGGGYPEMHAAGLSQNISMRSAVKEAIENGMPCLAECGGFMYLHRQLEGVDGERYPMVGIIPGEAIREERLVRFGYVDICGKSDGVYLKEGEQLRGHEFHYWDSSQNGSDCLAGKPDGSKAWQCIHMTGNLFAGYPHIHFYSNPVFAGRFARQVKQYAGRKEETDEY